MNTEIKAAWVAALRSGEYQQGRGSLHSIVPVYDRCEELVGEDDRFCCLGVLCDLAEKAGVVESAVRRGPLGTRVDYQEESSYLPGAVTAWAGLPEPNPALGSGGPYLVNYNDSGHGFLEIAKLIEESL